jgi:hypothetical protein
LQSSDIVLRRRAKKCSVVSKCKRKILQSLKLINPSMIIEAAFDIVNLVSICHQRRSLWGEIEPINDFNYIVN